MGSESNDSDERSLHKSSDLEQSSRKRVKLTHGTGDGDGDNITTVSINNTFSPTKESDKLQQNTLDCLSISLGNSDEFFLFAHKFYKLAKQKLPCLSDECCFEYAEYVVSHLIYCTFGFLGCCLHRDSIEFTPQFKNHFTSLSCIISDTDYPSFLEFCRLLVWEVRAAVKQDNFEIQELEGILILGLLMFGSAMGFYKHVSEIVERGMFDTGDLSVEFVKSYYGNLDSSWENRHIEDSSPKFYQRIIRLYLAMAIFDFISIPKSVQDLIVNWLASECFNGDEGLGHQHGQTLLPSGTPTTIIKSNHEKFAKYVFLKYLQISEDCLPLDEYASQVYYWNEQLKTSGLWHLLMTSQAQTEKFHALFQCATDKLSRNQDSLTTYERKLIESECSSRATIRLPVFKIQNLARVPRSVWNVHHVDGFVVNPCGLTVDSQGFTGNESLSRGEGDFSRALEVTKSDYVETQNSIHNLKLVCMGLELSGSFSDLQNFGKPLFLLGPPSCGKSVCIERAFELMRRKQKMRLIKLNASSSEQLDVRALFGCLQPRNQHQSTSSPQQPFEFRLGLIGKSLINGWWLVLDGWNLHLDSSTGDLNRSSSLIKSDELLGTLLAGLERGYFLLPGFSEDHQMDAGEFGKRIKIHPNFRLIIVSSLGASSSANIQQSRIQFKPRWNIVELGQISDEDREAIGWGKVKIWNRSVFTGSDLEHATLNNHPKNSLWESGNWVIKCFKMISSVRTDNSLFFKWLNRIIVYEAKMANDHSSSRFMDGEDRMLIENAESSSGLNIAQRKLIFTHGMDLLASSIPSSSKRRSFGYMLGVELLNLPKQVIEWTLYQREPRVEISHDKSTLSIDEWSISRSGFSNRNLNTHSTSKTFALTNHSKRLLEQLIRAIQPEIKEPVLLVGETGTGKTTAVQFIADVLGIKLHVFNMSQQSDSSDLLGGFKPLDIRTHLVLPIKELFDWCFKMSFSVSKNTKFIEAVKKAFLGQNWIRLASLWKMGTEMFEKKLLKESDPKFDGKPVLINNPKLKNSWKKLVDQVKQFDLRLKISHSGSSQNPARSDQLIFGFVEGGLVKALRNGDWILLDEINMASQETLQAISSLFDGSKSSIMLSDRGDDREIPRHPGFRVFACMNPSTDVGKKDLSPSMRSKFTEFWVGSPDENVELIKRPTEKCIKFEFDTTGLAYSDLCLLIKKYLEYSVFPDEIELSRKDDSTKCIHAIAKFYLHARKLSSNHQLASGSANSSEKPHFSIRTLARSLIYASKSVNMFGPLRAIYEGLFLMFCTLLDWDSLKILQKLLIEFLFDGMTPQSISDILSKHAKTPLNMTPVDVETNYFKISCFLVPRGKFPPSEEQKSFLQKYIITKSVENNLLNVTRTLISGYPILLQGPTSAGKTSMIEYLAYLTDNKFIRINNHEHTDIQEYLGSYSWDDNSGTLVFREGALVQALRNGWWVVLDELNLAPTDVLEALNRLLDDNKELFIPETGEYVRPAPGFMLFATQNPAGSVYGGRKYLSRAFRNRFIELNFSNIPSDELVVILERRCLIAPSYAKKMVSVFLDLQKKRTKDKIFSGKEGLMTLRDLFRWAGRENEGGEQPIGEDGYMLLAERVRQNEQKIIIKQTLEKNLRCKLDIEKLYEFYERDFAKETVDDSIVWTKAMKRLYKLVERALTHKEPVLLVGETGCGKTTVGQLYAQLHGSRIDIVNCHQHSETSDFIGSMRPCRKSESLMDSDELMEKSSLKLFEWQNGPLVNAMRDGYLFLLDEISLAEDSVLERLNSVLEPSRLLVIAEKGSDGIEQINGADGFQFLATMNPGGDFGKKELSPALRNRFTEIWVGKPWADDQDLKLILKKRLNLAEESDKELVCCWIIGFVEWVSSEYGLSAGSFSLRDLLTWVDFINSTINIFQTAVNLKTAFMHGLSLVFLDGIGLNSSGGISSNDSESILELKNNYMKKIFEILDLEENDHWENLCAMCCGRLKALTPVVITEKTFGIESFKISLGPRNLPETQNFFTASTTLSNTLRVLRAMQLPKNKPILLEGSPGVGKTSLINAIASASGYELVRINLSEQTDLIDLFGSDLPVEDSEVQSESLFSWRDGPFLAAMKRGDWVLLDELNLANQSVLEGLNACLDHRSTVYIPELDKYFECSPNFRVFGAQNPLNQGGGRKGLPQSFLNRFCRVYVDELSNDDMFIICKNSYPNVVSDDVLKCMINFNSLLHEATMIRCEFGTSGRPWEFNLRDLFRWLDLLSSFQKSGSDNSEFNYSSPAHFADFIYLSRMRTAEDRKSVIEIYERAFSAKFEPFENLLFQISPKKFVIGSAQLSRKEILISDTPYLTKPILKPLQQMMRCIQMNWMPILVGNTNTGKTSLIRLLGKITGNRIEEISLTHSMDAMDLLGGYEQVDIKRSGIDLLESILGNFKSIFRRFIEICRYKDVIDAQNSLNAARNLILNGKYSEACSGILSLARKYDVQVDEFTSKQWDKFKYLVEFQSSKRANFEWVDGIFIEALQKGFWIVLDNANLCNPSVLDRLNSLLEPGGSLIMSERGIIDGKIQCISPHPNFRLFITMDPENGGELSRAMRNRGIEIYMGSETEGSCDYDLDRFKMELRIPTLIEIKSFPELHRNSYEYLEAATESALKLDYLRHGGKFSYKVCENSLENTKFNWPQDISTVTMFNQPTRFLESIIFKILKGESSFSNNLAFFILSGLETPVDGVDYQIIRKVRDQFGISGNYLSDLFNHKKLPAIYHRVFICLSSYLINNYLSKIQTSSSSRRRNDMNILELSCLNNEDQPSNLVEEMSRPIFPAFMLTNSLLVESVLKKTYVNFDELYDILAVQKVLYEHSISSFAPENHIIWLYLDSLPRYFNEFREYRDLSAVFGKPTKGAIVNRLWNLVTEKSFSRKSNRKFSDNILDRFVKMAQILDINSRSPDMDRESRIHLYLSLNGDLLSTLVEILTKLMSDNVNIEGSFRKELESILEKFSEIFDRSQNMALDDSRSFRQNIWPILDSNLFKREFHLISKYFPDLISASEREEISFQMLNHSSRPIEDAVLWRISTIGKLSDGNSQSYSSFFALLSQWMRRNWIYDPLHGASQHFLAKSWKQSHKLIKLLESSKISDIPTIKERVESLLEALNSGGIYDTRIIQSFSIFILKNLCDIAGNFVDITNLAHSVNSLGRIIESKELNFSDRMDLNLKLGSIWVELGFLFLDLNFPDHPVDPGMKNNAEILLMEEKISLIEEKISAMQRIYYAFTGRHIESRNDAEQVKIRMLRAHCEKLRNSLPKRKKQSDISPYFQEIREFLEANLTRHKLEILYQLRRKDPWHHYQLLQHKLSSFIAKLRITYPDLVDLTECFENFTAFIRTGISLIFLEEFMPGSSIVNAISSMVTIPDILNSDELTISNNIASKYSSKHIQDKLKHYMRDLKKAISMKFISDIAQSRPLFLNTLAELCVIWEDSEMERARLKNEENSIYKTRASTYNPSEEDENYFKSYYEYCEEYTSSNGQENLSDSALKEHVVDSNTLDHFKNEIVDTYLLYYGLCPQNSEKMIEYFETDRILQLTDIPRELLDDALEYPVDLEISMLPLLKYRLRKFTDELSMQEVAFSIYERSNLFEMSKAVDSILRLNSKILDLLENWPDNPVLLQIKDISDRILGFDFRVPLIKVLVGFDLLMTKAQEWENYASKVYSLSEELASISEIIIRWRKMEIECWKDLLNSQERNYSSRVNSSWLQIYITLTSVPKNPDYDYYRQILEGINDFMTLATAGDFSRRLKMVQAIANQLEECSMETQSKQVDPGLGSYIWNFYSYYSQFEPFVINYVQRHRKPLEKELREFVKLATWKDINYFSLKESAEKTHQHLNKILKKFKNDILSVPFTRLVIDYHSELDWNLVSKVDCLQDSSFQLQHDISSLPSNEHDIENCVSYTPTMSQYGFQNIYSRFKARFEDFHKKIPRFSQVNEISDEILARLAFFQEENTKYPEATAENIGAIKNLRKIKQAAFAELLKVLKEIGLRPVNSKSNSDIVSYCKYYHFKNCKNLEFISIYIEKLENYYPKIVSRMENLRSSSLKPSEQVTRNQVDRASNLVTCLENLVSQQRYSLTSSIATISKLKDYFDFLESFKSPEFVRVDFIDHQCMKEFVENFKIICHSLMQFRIIYKLKSTDIVSNQEAESKKLLAELLDLNRRPFKILVTENETSLIGRVGKFLDDLRTSLKFNNEIVHFIEKELKIHQNLLSHSEKSNEEIMGDEFSMVADLLMQELMKSNQDLGNWFAKSNLGPIHADEASFEQINLPMSSSSLLSVIRLLRFDSILQLLQRLESLISHTKHAAILFSLSKFISVYRKFTKIILEKILMEHHASTKLLYIICNSLNLLFQRGYCLPENIAEYDDNTEEEKGKLDGTGMAEGSGAKDVSEEIEDEEEVLGLKGESVDEPEDEEIKEEENGIEMSNDFEGKLENVNPEEIEEQDIDETNNDQEPEEQMGDLNDNPMSETIDEKMWNGDDDDPEKSANEESGGPSVDPSQVDQTEMVANEDGEHDEPKTDKSKNEDSKDETKNQVIDQSDNESGEDKNEENEADSGDDADFGLQPRVDEKIDAEGDLDNETHESGDNAEIPDDLNLDDIEDDLNMQEGMDDIEESENLDEKQSFHEFSDDEAEHSSDVDEREPEIDEDLEQQENENDETQKDGQDASNNSGLDELQVAKDHEDQLHGSQGFVSGQNAEKDADESNEMISEGQGMQDLEMGNHEYSEGMAQNSMEYSTDIQKKESNNEIDEERSLAESIKSWNKRLNMIESQEKPSNSEAVEEDSRSHEMDAEFLKKNEELSNAKEMAAYGSSSTEQRQDTELFSDQESNEDENMDHEESDSRKMNEEIQDSKEDSNNDIQSHSKKPEKKHHKADPANLQDTKYSDPRMGIQEEETYLAWNENNNIANKSSLENEVSEVNFQKFENPVDMDEEASDHEFSMDELRIRMEENLAIMRSNRASSLEQGNQLLPKKIWHACSRRTESSAVQLCERLKLILEPTLNTHLKGDYRTGKRLNMRKIIPFIASDFKKDKIWLRRTKPKKREYQVLIAIDDSKSMSESKSIRLTYESLSLLSKALSRLEIGQVGIISFGEEINLVHPFEKPLTDESGVDVISQFNFDQDKTNVKKLMQESLCIMENQRSSSFSQRSGDLWQLQIVISDGICEDHDTIKRLVRKAAESKILVLFIIIDQRSEAENIMSTKSVSFGNDGKLILKGYMDSFPFDYFLVLRDLQGMPDLLADALRQWFEISREFYT